MLHARADYQHIQDSNYKIPMDEPVFLIRAQDSVGFLAVRKYAALLQGAGADKAMVESVMAHALLMEAWPKKKLADIPPGTPIQSATEVPVRDLDADSSGNGVEEG